MKLYMAIDDTEYELPIAIAECAEDLAEMVGVSPKTVYLSATRAREGRKSRFIVVEIPQGKGSSNG